MFSVFFMKSIFYIFFSIHKNGKQVLSKTQRKTLKVKDIKIVLKKKKTKGEKRSETDTTLPEEQK